jgi:hypothetical protein
MKKLFNRGEAGMSTSEYAVGTLGACTIGGVLVKIGHTYIAKRVFSVSEHSSRASDRIRSETRRNLRTHLA